MPNSICTNSPKYLNVFHRDGNEISLYRNTIVVSMKFDSLEALAKRPMKIIRPIKLPNDRLPIIVTVMSEHALRAMFGVTKGTPELDRR